MLFQIVQHSLTCAHVTSEGHNAALTWQVNLNIIQTNVAMQGASGNHAVGTDHDAFPALDSQDQGHTQLTKTLFLR